MKWLLPVNWMLTKIRKNFMFFFFIRLIKTGCSFVIKGVLNLFYAFIVMFTYIRLNFA